MEDDSEDGNYSPLTDGGGDGSDEEEAPKAKAKDDMRLAWVG